MSEAEVTAEKARWRERFRAARRSQPPQALAHASGKIVTRLLDLVPVDSSEGAIGLFWPLPGEVDLRPLADALRQRGTAVALPVVTGPRQLEWRRFKGANRLVPGRWGLREPGPDAAVISPAALSAIAVPGLAFGRDGSRLGYGGGFYDSALSATEAARLGVAVDAALVDAVPCEAHDAWMDTVVTDQEMWRVR